MEALTVGYLEKELRKYPKETEVFVACNSCHRSSVGSTDIIRIDDMTNQTFGYIEIVVNDTIKPNVEFTKDKEEFYKAEVDRLTKEKEELEYEVFEYKNKLRAIANELNKY